MTIYDPLKDVVPVVFQASLVAAGLLVGGGVLAKQRLEAGGVLPDEGITLRNVFEALIEFLDDLAQSVMGEHARDYMGLVATLFFFILISNLLGLVPMVGGATSFVETAFTWASIAFVVYNYVGIRTHGAKYIYQFMGPAIWHAHIGGKEYHVRLMTPLFLPLELLLHLARIATLTVRLVANMFADHTVVSIFVGLTYFVVPAIFMGLGTLVAFLQAFVFSLLTMIYIGSALEEAH